MQTKLDSFIALLNASGLICKKQRFYLHYLRNGEGMSDSNSLKIKSHESIAQSSFCQNHCKKALERLKPAGTAVL